MLRSDHFYYSVVDYRSDPSAPDEGAIVLGFVLEFLTPNFWVVACAMRDAIDQKRLEQMDPLTRELLEKPGSLLDGEIRAAMTNAQKPGDVLKYLAASNPWSIHIRSPRELELESGSKLRDASIDKLAEQYLFQIYEILIEAKETAAPPQAHRLPWYQSFFHPREETEFDDALGMFPDVPPVWMTPPRTWQAPIIWKK